jgi:uncharacterized membrane protein HdeD (DUF308 family)
MEITVARSLRHWWVFLLRGILFILVGIYMIASPVVTLAALGVMFGLIFFLAGAAELFQAAREPAGNRAWHLILGVIDVILGIMLMGHVAAGVTILRIIVGIWFFFKGVSLLSFSRVGGSGMLVLGGILSIIFALLILFNPAFGAITIILYIAIGFIMMGLFNVMFGLRMRSVLK